MLERSSPTRLSQAGNLRRSTCGILQRALAVESAWCSPCDAQAKRNILWPPKKVPATGTNMVDLAADIVSAYVSHNSVQTSDLAALIGAVHSALSNVGKPASEAPRSEAAVPVKKSITPDHLISLFDEKKYKSLKRPLRTSHNMTP